MEYALVIALIFIAAYSAKLLLFFFLKKIFSKGIASTCVKSVEKGASFLFLEAAALASLPFLPLSDTLFETLGHLLIIVILATVGATLIALASGICHYIRDKHVTESIEEISKRSLLTQTQILYRVVLFLIIAITLAAILLTFPSIKTLGIGILGSAGIVGVALGIAAKPILLNLMSGFQIAFSKRLKIGDAVVVEGEQGIVEQIFLTHVVVKTWDLRRIFLPISNFIDKSYENWSNESTELVGFTILNCDFTAPVAEIRKKFDEILHLSESWNRRMSSLEVVELGEETMKIRLSMTAATPAEASKLRSYVNEKMIEFLQKEYPASLPRVRYHQGE